VGTAARIDIERYNNKGLRRGYGTVDCFILLEMMLSGVICNIDVQTWRKENNKNL